MEILLTQDVERLGKAGETKAVKDGYARNFLFPRGWAVPATLSNRQRVDFERMKRLQEIQRRKALAEDLKSRIEQLSCSMAASVGEQGKLHGAVTSADIAAALAAEGISVQKHQIVLERPVARLGEHVVSIKLHPGVVASLKIRVVPR